MVYYFLHKSEVEEENDEKNSVFDNYGIMLSVFYLGWFLRTIICRMISDRGQLPLAWTFLNSKQGTRIFLL